MAQDEFLEHGNRIFSEFPMPRSLTGFARQSIYVGIALMTKQFSNFWYTVRFKLDREATYNRSVAPVMTPEKRVIYEIMTLMKSETEDSNRQLHKSYVVERVDSKITTELKRTKLEGQINDCPATSADDMLKTLDQIYEESIVAESGGSRWQRGRGRR